jgi:phage terminase large subunit-like protein
MYARVRGEYWLLDEERDRWGIVESAWAVRRLAARWPACKLVVLEDAKAGPAVQALLLVPYPDPDGKKIWPALPVRMVGVVGTKLERLGRVEHYLSGARSLLRLPQAATWLAGWIREAVTFSGREHEINDRVDVLTMALAWWKTSSSPIRIIGGDERASAGFR